MIIAKNYRNKSVLNSVPNDKPGYYKWWAEKAEFDKLLGVLGLNLSDISGDIEVSDGKYCIYVGIAAKESIRNRINWHVNDPHTPSRVKNGTLSTLRQSISSVVAGDQYDKKATDDFIDKLYIEYFTINCEIKSEESKSKLKEIENGLMNKNLYILNIQDNHHPKAVTKKLKELRKKAKNSL